MKLLSLTFVALLFLITGCDNPTSVSKNETRPTWGKWLSPNVEHPEKRLEIKFGNVLYQIPVSYLVGKGSNEKLGDPSDNSAVYAIANYPDLVPVHKMHELKIPMYPQIQIILGGHKDDPYTTIDPMSKKEEPYPPAYANDIKKCGEPRVSSLARDMYQYNCNVKNGQLYFTPIDANIKTQVGYKVYIGCFDSLLYVKYECAIHSRLFDDGRYLTTRIYLDDLSSLLDIYYKTIQLLTSLEASNQ